MVTISFGSQWLYEHYTMRHLRLILRLRYAPFLLPVLQWQNIPKMTAIIVNARLLG
jgi:hypothetical protein